MDSITQFALGAAIGEATLGKKIGRKAMLWGGLAGTIPDLDILASPFLDEVAQLAFHRGLSHAFAFCITLAPVLGWGIHRLHRKRGVTWGRTTLMAFLALVTHPLLDTLTVYGTQLFQPFSDYPASYATLFIIDPLYTLPLVIGLLWSLCFKLDRSARRIGNALGLALSSLYLLFSIGAKQVVDQQFQQGFSAQGLPTANLLTSPTPLNTVLWSGMVERDDTLYVGLYSLKDTTPPTVLQAIPRNSALLDGQEQTLPVQRLRWFSRGYYSVRQRDSTLYFHDLRFGRSDVWMQEKGQYVFTFELMHDARGRIVNFRQLPPRADFDFTQTLRQVFTRAFP